MLKILVVDDSVMDRFIIKRALSEYCVLTAVDGLEAMRVLKEDEGINLLILDLDVPKMNGFQVLKALPKEGRFRKPRTIILTDVANWENESKGLKLGAVDFIRKPIHMASLKARIDLHVALFRAEQGLVKERKTIEKALHESERSKAVFLSHLPGLAYRCNYDPDWTMQYVSQGCFNLTGYPPESLLYNRDLSYNDLISPEYREALWNEWKRILPAKQPFKYEYEIITATGERKWVLELGQGIYNEKGEVEALEGIILDISERKAMEDTLKYNNEHVQWTGLYNRDYLVSFLAKEIKRKQASKKALIGINLSMVQLIIANYGFQYAQNLLKKAAEALSRHCASNRLLFHVQENRFVFYLCDYKDKNELVGFSNVIIETLESLFVTDRISGGIGIVEIEPDLNEADIDLLLGKLQIASERSVNLVGRNFEICFFDQELEALVNREREIMEALQAIAAEEQTNDQLFLQYQPILNLRTGLICGFEALARLRTEKLGLVSPVEFIPLAEKTKLILAIGEKVIMNAFRFLNKLKEKGYDQISVSINVSVIQLLNPDFADRLFALINEMQVNPKNVGIEITESVFASDFAKINNVIGRLRGAGLHVAIDDFGTGYSSPRISVNSIT